MNMNEIEYLKTIIAPLLAKPEEIEIERIEDERGILLQVTVNGYDVGKLIGKKGNTATALRLLLHIFGSRIDKVVSLKINPQGFEPKLKKEIKEEIKKEIKEEISENRRNKKVKK